MFMGPLEASLPWSTGGLDGAKRYLDRVYRLFTEETYTSKFTNENDGKLDFIYHSTVKKVTHDFEALQFNTAISQMMILTNEFYKADKIYIPYLEGFIKMFDCICPHLGEELWEMMGHKDVIVYEAWPTYDENKIQLDTIKIAVSVNGKLRATLEVNKGLSEDELKALAFETDGVKRHIENKEIKKVIVVKDKIINIVAI
jgi:leucyl-tRNA synthetase